MPRSSSSQSNCCTKVQAQRSILVIVLLLQLPFLVDEWQNSCYNGILLLCLFSAGWRWSSSLTAVDRCDHRNCSLSASFSDTCATYATLTCSWKSLTDSCWLSPVNVPTTLFLETTAILCKPRRDFSSCAKPSRLSPAKKVSSLCFTHFCFVFFNLNTYEFLTWTYF